jgi:hypothetical protein
LEIKGNLNPFDGSNSLASKFVSSILRIVPPSIGYVSTLNIAKIQIYSNASYGKSFMSKISYNLSKMLVSCWYSGYQCYPSDFDLFTTFEQGNCYIFNFNTFLNNNSTESNKTLRTASQTGKIYGLSLELFAGIDGELNSYIFNL